MFAIDQPAACYAVRLKNTRTDSGLAIFLDDLAFTA